MRRALRTDRGSELYGKRQPMIEPVFANTKFDRKMTRFHRRGRAAARTEWRLIAATHNPPQAPQLDFPRFGGHGDPTRFRWSRRMSRSPWNFATAIL
jgi:hypothetical protein